MTPPARSRYPTQIEPRFRRPCQRLSRHWRLLQAAYQSRRRHPMPWQHRRSRVAHEAARVEGRQVEVVTVGDETGLDRAVQDKAFEPLLHVVRNAVGHGIEAPADRLKAGKPTMGKITLEARREGNTLMISVRDDGRGLDHEAIAAKARRLGLLAAGEQPSIERLNNLIFRSGFSTKQDVSEISG